MPEAQADVPGRRVWLYDRRDYWRSYFSQVLTASGFSVRSVSRYSYPPPDALPDDEPDLVVLGCARAEEDEKDLIQRAAARHHYILVLASSRNADSIRALFLAGAYDVTGTPSNADQLLALVHQTLAKVLRARQREALLWT